MTTRFDDSLPVLATIVAQELGERVLANGLALRDATGQLAFFSEEELDPVTVARVATKLSAALGGYARADRVLAGAGEFGVAAVMRQASAQRVKAGSQMIRLLDRRLVGADWTRAPFSSAPLPPRVVFASLKGGVGRSTALCVTAAQLAATDHRVLAIDLDMEAPGLGAMLLDDGTIPEFGVLDALVEGSLSKLDDGFLTDMVGPSALADRRGRIDVVPAFGRRSIQNPGDVLAKISRAYTETVCTDGTVATLLDQTRSLVDQLANPKRYDAVLVDARAGLHETAASAILGLGADILLFGLNDRQTIQGYSALLSHLSRFNQPDRTAPTWLDRLSIVQAKAPASMDARAEFTEKCRALFMQSGIVGSVGQSSNQVITPAAPFNDVPWDDDAEDEYVLPDNSIGEPIPILEDERFRLFDPLANFDLLSKQVYQSSYGVFLDRINRILGTDAGSLG